MQVATGTNTVKTTLLTTAAMTFALLQTGSAIALPTPNEDGDYSGRSRHTTWQVVDVDPNGLNCRMEGSFQDILDDRYNGVDPNIIDMPVVATLEYGKILEAGTTPAGNVLLGDDRGLPWVYASEPKCFVRANSSFISPISSPEAIH